MCYGITVLLKINRLKLLYFSLFLRVELRAFKEDIYGHIFFENNSCAFWGLPQYYVTLFMICYIIYSILLLCNSAESVYII